MNHPDSPTADPRRVHGPAAPRVGDRLVAIDAARGLALLGIVLVNVDFFALPLGVIELPGPYEEGVGAAAAWTLVAVFCSGKFYPLFALLFGIGIVLHRESVEAQGAGYVPLAIRRLVLLGLLGIAHVAFLWYGDILFLYATAGLVVALLGGRPPRALLVTAGLFLVIALLGTAAVISWMPTSPGAGEARRLLAEAEAVEVEGSPLAFFLEQVGEEADEAAAFASPESVAAEIAAHRRGGPLDALGFRLISWMALLAAGAVSSWWAIVGFFLLGAGLARLRVFRDADDPWPVRFLLAAMLVGLPLSAVAVLLGRSAPQGATAIVTAVLPLLVGPLVALGYLSAVVLAVRHGILSAWTGALAATGRLALTHYLLQSLVLAFVFEFWGLGRFAAMSGPGRLLLAVALFAAQVAVSGWWLDRFRFGPAEWAWRSLTYGRRQAFRRASAVG